MSKNKPRILVLCTGNSCRSQMAEGFFNAYGGDSIEVFSAGLEPHGVNPMTIKVMREVGIDISGHTSNNLKEYLDMEFDYVITVCDNAAEKCPVFPGPKGHPERSRRATLGSHPELVEGHVPSEAEGRLPKRLHWPFFDPASVLKSGASETSASEEEVLQIFRKVRDEIGEKVMGRVSQSFSKHNDQ